MGDFEDEVDIYFDFCKIVEGCKVFLVCVIWREDLRDVIVKMFEILGFYFLDVIVFY